MLKKVEYEQAMALLAGLPVRPRTETVPLEAALGRNLAEDIRAAFPMPPFDKSPFDGYAFRAQDAPGTLRVCGESVTGCEELPPLTPGTAMRIFTGAPVPEGADAVVKQEETEAVGDAVRIPVSFRPGFNVIRRGEDYPEGAVLLTAGTRLGPAQLGTLATQGLDAIPVYQKPKALFLSTGTELSEPGQPRRRYGIYNSSYYSLSGYLRMMGFDVARGGTLADDLAGISGRIREGLESDADLVITTGGASVGDYDFAMRAARALDMEILFWKVRAKPGGALLAAWNGDKLLLSLSGNPAAAMMSLLVVAQPYLRRLAGSNVGNEQLELPLLNGLTKRSRSVRMLRGHAAIRDGVTWFEENPGRGNGNIASFGNCDMIGIIPGGSEPLPEGAAIRVLRLPPDLRD